VTRRYPLDLPPEPPTESQVTPRRSWLREGGLAIRAARVTASILVEFSDWRRAHLDLAQAISTVLLLVFGLALAASAGQIDEYLHRGVETGVEQPYVVQPAGKELATNVNLVPYAGDGLIEMIDAIASSGFRYVRQEVSWASIEAEAGSRDFRRYDELVAQLSRRKIQIIFVVIDAPDWAMIPDPTSADATIIVDPDAFSAFLEELTSRYSHEVGYVQIWDRPNLNSATPVGAIGPNRFTRLLAAGSNGAKAGNPEVKILLPELAASSDLELVPTDLAYLGALYDSGASSFFDIVGIVLDGTTFSPDDRRVGAERFNMSRAILIRELMQDRDDGQRPIWATSYGWSASESVSRETQAEFVTRGLERSWAEWPWMGLMVQWQFLAESGSPDEPYSIVMPDGSATPLYNRLTSGEVQEESLVAHTGFAPMDGAALQYQGNWQDQHLEGRTFKTNSQVGSSITFRFSGTGVIAFMRSGPQVGEFLVTLDGEVIEGGAESDPARWDFWWWETRDVPLTLLSGLEDTNHQLTITLAAEGELTLGGMVVARDAPFTWPIMLMAAASFISLFLAMRSFIYLVAVRAGHLLRKGTMQNPQLPTMPNWRPSRRV
jgi:hypothetical protein